MCARSVERALWEQAAAEGALLHVHVVSSADAHQADHAPGPLAAVPRAALVQNKCRCSLSLAARSQPRGASARLERLLQRAQDTQTVPGVMDTPSLSLVPPRRLPWDVYVRGAREQAALA